MSRDIFKDVFKKIIIIISLILFSSCAKPPVIEIKKQNDENLSCDQLDLAVFEAQKFKDDAELSKGGTGGNIGRMLIFWPAWATSFHNADVAIAAANDRIYHLSVIMKKKKCKNSKDSESGKIISITTELKELKKLYDNGEISKMEYKKAKKKLIN